MFFSPSTKDFTTIFSLQVRFVMRILAEGAASSNSSRIYLSDILGYIKFRFSFFCLEIPLEAQAYAPTGLQLLFTIFIGRCPMLLLMPFQGKKS
jgi:hypothetical protein